MTASGDLRTPLAVTTRVAAKGIVLASVAAKAQLSTHEYVMLK